jgi:hypothetical protein
MGDARGGACRRALSRVVEGRAHLSALSFVEEGEQGIKVLSNQSNQKNVTYIWDIDN